MSTESKGTQKETRFLDVDPFQRQFSTISESAIHAIYKEHVGENKDKFRDKVNHLRKLDPDYLSKMAKLKESRPKIIYDSWV